MTYDYYEVLDAALYGEMRTDRTGTGTRSIFAPKPMVFSLTDFELPLLHEKKVSFLNILTELLWFIRGDLVRDFLALNRLEILPWDTYGLISKHDSQLTLKEMELLDKIAGLTLQPDEAFDEILSIYANTPDLRVPPAWIPINQ